MIGRGQRPAHRHSALVMNVQQLISRQRSDWRQLVTWSVARTKVEATWKKSTSTESLIDDFIVHASSRHKKTMLNVFVDTQRTASETRKEAPAQFQPRTNRDVTKDSTNESTDGAGRHWANETAAASSTCVLWPRTSFVTSSRSRDRGPAPLSQGRRQRDVTSCLITITNPIVNLHGYP